MRAARESDPDQPNHDVSAAELVRNFPHVRDRALTAPIAITNHGRRTHMLVSADAWDAMNAVSSCSSESAESAFELAKWVDLAVIVCDANLCVIKANRIAESMTRRPQAAIVGQVIGTALREVSGTLIETHARRCARSGEPSVVDLPSPFTPSAWLHLQVFAMGSRVVLLLRDITDEVNHHRLADVKAAIIEAIALNSHAVYARLSVRGTIDRIDPAFPTLLALPESRLLGLPLADLATTGDRAQLRAAIDAVLREGQSQVLESTFLTNNGTIEPMHIAMVQLHGAYGCEGAVVLMTTRPRTAV